MSIPGGASHVLPFDDWATITPQNPQLLCVQSPLLGLPCLPFFLLLFLGSWGEEWGVGSGDVWAGEAELSLLLRMQMIPRD